VEVTESMMIDQKSDVLDALHRLQGLGVKIAIGCDFAQGYLYAKAMTEAGARQLLASPTWRQR
jgi:EAL domain-containing protein (putative c-di-GMP-specific phosphodiesterase class I)